MSRTIPFYTGSPVICRSRNNWPSLLFKPDPVLCYTIVIPCSQSHAGGNMIFKGPAQCPNGCFLHSTCSTFPGIHRAIIAMVKCIFFSRFKTFEPVFYHGFRELRMQNQQGGKHPDICIPENMAVITKSTQAHG